jgi:polar amino acid transport system substrate-binding protein
VRDLLGKLRLETLDELPWHESGVYISRTSVSAAERALLASQLRAAYQSNAVWEQFKRFYPPEVVAISARPR